MPVSPELYSELAKALSRPSKAYRATEQGLGIPNSAMEGYMAGSEYGDKLQSIKFGNQTLDQALGGDVPDSVSKYRNLSVKQFKPTAELLTGVGAIEKANPYEAVMSQDDALKLGKVPKGTKIVKPDGTHITYLGPDQNGRPIGVNQKGETSIIALPEGSSFVAPKSSTAPTASERQSAGTAKVIIPLIDSMGDLIDRADAKGLIGPGSARINNLFLAGKVGTTGNPENDSILGELRAVDTFVKSGAMKVHFGSRGGQQMYEHFSTILNSGKQSSAQLKGALKGIRSVLTGYAKEGSMGGYNPPENDISSMSEDDLRAAAVQ